MSALPAVVNNCSYWRKGYGCQMSKNDCFSLSEFLEALDQEIHRKSQFWGVFFNLLLSNNYLKKTNVQLAAYFTLLRK